MEYSNEMECVHILVTDDGYDFCFVPKPIPEITMGDVLTIYLGPVANHEKCKEKLVRPNLLSQHHRHNTI